MSLQVPAKGITDELYLILINAILNNYPGKVIGSKNVNAKIESHGRGPKIKIIKFRRRKHHRKQMGHRQAYTEIKITNIAVN